MEMMCAEYLMLEGKRLTCRELVWRSDWDDDSAGATPAASLTSYSFHAGLVLHLVLSSQWHSDHVHCPQWAGRLQE